MKGKLHWLVVLACVVVLAFGGVISWEYLHTAPLADERALSRCIQRTYGCEVDQIHAFQEDQGVAALLTTATEEGAQSPQTVMFLLEQSWLSGRYHVTGSATGTSPQGDYRYSDLERTITVVYGDNRKANAAAYCFAIGDRLYGQKDLGDYVLGLFVTGPSTENVSAVQWYNAAGNEMSLGGKTL